VNSFYFEPKDKNTVVASTNYGNNFCSIIEKENIFGVQFHPEKSQKAGQILLKNFLNLNI
jgi:glutamine amidotransferase